MESPFPGMDPYLEASALWPDVHNSLIFAIREQLQPLLSPRYIAVTTPYTLLESLDIVPTRTVVPDVGIVERTDGGGTATLAAIASPPLVGQMVLEFPTRYQRIEIRTVANETLVTAIELLSPANKRPGADGAEAYARKRRELFRSDAHLLEIDLLRGGKRPDAGRELPDEPYFVFLSRAERRPLIYIWPMSLREALPVVAVPLLPPDADLPLDLTAALKRIYTTARYDLRIDYGQVPPPPEMGEDDATWVRQVTSPTPQSPPSRPS